MKHGVEHEMRTWRERGLDHVLGAELCPPMPQIHMLKSSFLEPQNVAVFGDRAFKEVINTK